MTTAVFWEGELKKSPAMLVLPVISAIVSFITLIVFFVMAANISKIKEILIKGNAPTNPKYIDVYNHGKMKEYQGKNPEALDLYSEAYYLLAKAIEQNPKSSGLIQHKETIAGRIKSIGGVVKAVTN